MHFVRLPCREQRERVMDLGENLQEYCLRTGKTELLSQWHPTYNDGLSPEKLSYSSRQKVWWQCEKGHTWQAIVKSRTSGCGCPVCAHRLLVLGENDLATTHPELAGQWHPTKNGSLTPREVMAGTRKKVWWQCEKGHEWQASVGSRAQGAGCPVCAGKKIIPGENDMASMYPDIASQWDTEKNGPLTPDAVSPYSNRRVWWKCPLGHEYRMPVSHRTMRGSGCPCCTGRKVLPGFNDLKTLEPDIAEQWYEPLNAPLTPEMVTVGARRKVWWQCADGHVWQSVIYSRTGPMKCGCPVCAGKARRKRPHRYAAVRETYCAAAAR